MDEILEKITLRDILRLLYRHKILFIVVPTILILFAYFGAELHTPTYDATVTMFIKARKTTEADYYQAAGGEITSEHTALVSSNLVLRRVVEALKLYERPIDLEMQHSTNLKKYFMKKNFELYKQQLQEMTPEQRKLALFDKALNDLKSNIFASTQGEGNIFSINVSDLESAKAVQISNALSRSYVIFDLEQQVEELKLKYGEKHSTVIQLQNYIEYFSETLDGRILPDLEAFGPASVKIVAQAISASQHKPLPVNLILLFMFLSGIFLAGIFSFVLDYFDNSLKTPKDIIKYLNVPLLGTIPKRKKKDELIMSDEHLARSSLKCVSSFQRLGDKICLLSKKDNIKTILITAFQELGDTSALIANLGIYLSRDAGKKVLIIDANLKNPTLANALHISDNSGLPDVFENKKTFEEAVVKAGENLDLLLSHTVSYRPITLLDSSFMSDLIEEARDKYDFVIIDCSANRLSDTDPVIISSLTDAVIVVINEGKDRYPAVQIAIGNITQNSNKPIFAVLNNRKENLPNILYKIS